jgi:phage antirepressor YoqD-like protein
METNIQILRQEILLGRNFTIYGDLENPLFLAKDVAEWIEHSDVSTMIRLVDEDEKLRQTLFVSGQNREVVLLTENGLYEVLMQSNKPIAKQFKKGVKEILQSIRKHGGYLTAQKLEEALLNPDTLIQLATNLKDERQKRLVAETTVKEQAPKVLFADAVATSDQSVLVSELAKILKQNGVDIGQNRLFSWLREHSYLCSKGEYYSQPSQKAMELGLFEIKKTSITKPDGTVLVTRTTKVTGKGQMYFVNKFLSQDAA